MKMKNILSLFIIIFIFENCSGNGSQENIAAQSNGTSQITTGKQYEIVNAALLANDISVPTTKTPDTSSLKKMSVSVTTEVQPKEEAKGTPADDKSLPIAAENALPATITFDASTFKMTYDDESYLVGHWEKISEGVIRIKFGSDSADFNFEFPDENAIKIWLNKIISTDAVGAEGKEPSALPEGTAVNVMAEGSSIPDWLKGTWCYASGYKNPASSNSLASLVFAEQSLVVPYYNLENNMGNVFESADVTIDSASHTFQLSYYCAKDCSLTPTYKITDDQMTIKYAPFKEASMKRISSGEAQCAGIKYEGELPPDTDCNTESATNADCNKEPICASGQLTSEGVCVTCPQGEVWLDNKCQKNPTTQQLVKALENLKKDKEEKTKTSLDAAYKAKADVMTAVNTAKAKQKLALDQFKIMSNQLNDFGKTSEIPNTSDSYQFAGIAAIKASDAADEAIKTAQSKLKKAQLAAKNTLEYINDMVSQADKYAQEVKTNTPVEISNLVSDIKKSADKIQIDQGILDTEINTLSKTIQDTINQVKQAPSVIEQIQDKQEQLENLLEEYDGLYNPKTKTTDKHYYDEDKKYWNEAIDKVDSAITHG